MKCIFGLACGLLLTAASIVQAAPINSSFEDPVDFAGWTLAAGANSGNFSFYDSSGTGVNRSGSPAFASNGIAGAVLNFWGFVPPGGTGEGPRLTSSTFALNAGQGVTVDYRAIGADDHVIARGFLVNAATNLVADTFFNVGPLYPGDASFVTALANAPISGNYYLRFELASYDSTFGELIGAQLRLDNIVVQQEVPEPASLAVWGLVAATGGLLGYRRRQQQRTKSAA